MKKQEDPETARLRAALLVVYAITTDDTTKRWVKTVLEKKN